MDGWMHGCMDQPIDLLVDLFNYLCVHLGMYVYLEGNSLHLVENHARVVIAIHAVRRVVGVTQIENKETAIVPSS
jgi:hypothetical protein